MLPRQIVRRVEPAVHSGQWGPRHGVYTVGSSYRGKSEYRKLIPINNRIHLPTDVLTMAEALKGGGYRTIHLGKYHIGNDPLEDGFEVNIGGDHTGGPKDGGYFSPWIGGSMEAWSDIVPAKTHRIDIYTAEAVKFIERYRDEPIFIHFSPYLVHGPITAVPEYVENFRGLDLNSAYYSMVEKLDAAIGILLQALEDQGLIEKTLVVFCSDNGGIAAVNSQSPWRAGKGSYYEGGVREPMLMNWPGTIIPGRCEAVVNGLDFYPTFMEVAGIKCSKQLDGVSLVPLIDREEGWEPVPQYWHFPIYLQAYNGAKDQARDPLFRTRPGSVMRLGNWKLHEYFEDNAIELYDLSKDPGEVHNIARVFPQKAAKMHQMLSAWRHRIGAPVPKKQNPKYNLVLEEKALKAFE